MKTLELTLLLFLCCLIVSFRCEDYEDNEVEIYGEEKYTLNNTECNLPQPIIGLLKYGNISECSILIDSKKAAHYNITIKCDQGYEFSYQVDTHSVLVHVSTFDEARLRPKLTCYESGCKLSEISDRDHLDSPDENQHNIDILESHCEKAYLDGYCKPDLSYIKFVCLDGYVLEHGLFEVKCLYSYLWDKFAFCVKPENHTTITHTTIVTTSTSENLNTTTQALTNSLSSTSLISISAASLLTTTVNSETESIMSSLALTESTNPSTSSTIPTTISPSESTNPIQTTVLTTETLTTEPNTVIQTSKIEDSNFTTLPITTETPTVPTTSFLQTEINSLESSTQISSTSTLFSLTESNLNNPIQTSQIITENSIPSLSTAPLNVSIRNTTFQIESRVNTSPTFTFFTTTQIKTDSPIPIPTTTVFVDLSNTTQVNQLETKLTTLTDFTLESTFQTTTETPPNLSSSFESYLPSSIDSKNIFNTTLENLNLDQTTQIELSSQTRYNTSATILTTQVEFFPKSTLETFTSIQPISNSVTDTTSLSSITPSLTAALTSAISTTSLVYKLNNITSINILTNTIVPNFNLTNTTSLSEASKLTNESTTTISSSKTLKKKKKLTTKKATNITSTPLTIIVSATIPQPSTTTTISTIVSTSISSITPVLTTTSTRTSSSSLSSTPLTPLTTSLSSATTTIPTTLTTTTETSTLTTTISTTTTTKTKIETTTRLTTTATTTEKQNKQKPKTKFTANTSKTTTTSITTLSSIRTKAPTSTSTTTTTTTISTKSVLLNKLVELNGGTMTTSFNMPNPCWKKMPRRPLNGRREVKLSFNTKDNTKSISSMNFTCNPFFDLVGGKSNVRCKNGIWERDIPECRLSTNTCLKKPAFNTKNSLNVTQISLIRYKIKLELDYGTQKELDIYLSVGFACKQAQMQPDSIMKNGLQENFVFADKTRKTEYKYFAKPLDRFITYQNASCIGPEQWESVPYCILG